MTPPRPSRFTASFGAASEQGGAGHARAKGRACVMAFAASLRTLRTYPAGNPIVRQAVEELTALVAEYVRDDGDFDCRLAGEFLFVNGTRLRLDAESWSMFDVVRATLRASGTGQLRAEHDASVAEWTTLLGFLLAPEGHGPAEAHVRLQQRLGDAGLESFDVAPPVQAEDDDSGGAEGASGGGGADDSRGSYTQGVAVLRDALRALATGEGLNVKRMKRMVQLIVDRVTRDEVRMLGLTTVRDYAEYEVTHAVNVCILAVGLGRRLGLSRLQLYDLGLAALFHDIGMGRVATRMPDSREPLSETEWAAVRTHPWQGVLVLFQMRELQEFPYRSMLVSYEHQMRDGGVGYPQPSVIEHPTLFSRIIAVADSYDAAVTTRAFRPRVLSPAEVLADMRRAARHGLDPVVIKAFSGMLGRWPVGTAVVLDTMELAIVCEANPSPEHFSRPVVRVIANRDRELQFPGELADLTERADAGGYRRTILSPVDPVRYGIKVGDYFVVDV